MRRSLLATAVIALLTSSVRADDWPQWMGPKRDGVWREEGILDKFPEGGPKVRWRKPIGTGYAGPAIVGDRIYVMDRVTDKPLLNDGYAKDAVAGAERVLCLDLKTGEQIWKHEYDCPYSNISYPSGPRTTPIIQDGKVWTLGTMGHLFCHDAATGNVLWSKNLKETYKHAPPIWGHSAHLLIDGKKLITLAGGDDSAVVALDKDNGTEIWHALSTGDVCYSPPTIFEIGGKRELIIWLSETLNGLDPESGKALWTLAYPENGEPKRPAANISQARVIGDVLFVSSFYHGPLAVRFSKEKSEPIVAYRGNTSMEPSKQPTLHTLMSTPAVVDGYLYGTGAMGEIQCVDAATGKRLWSDDKAIAKKKALFGTIFFVRNGDRFFLFTDQGDLLIAKLSPKGYEELGRAHLLETTQTAQGRDVVWSHPAFASKCMVARNDKEIICVELAKPE